MAEDLPQSPGFVVDATVALKWFLRLPDEPHVSEAVQLLEDYEVGRVGLVAPTCIRYEVGHALTRAWRRGRIDFPTAREALLAFVDLAIPALYDRALLATAAELSRTYGISFYDATYVAISTTYSLPLIHADARLRNLLAGRVPSETWIESYPARR
jgi:predicted nucleic acid-binding protein